MKILYLCSEGKVGKLLSLLFDIIKEKEDKVVWLKNIFFICLCLYSLEEFKC